MLDKYAGARASKFLYEYSAEKGIYLKINYFNADHTHVLIDLPTNYCVEDVIHLFKGAHHIGLTRTSSLEENSRGKGYGAFSVSHSDVGRVAAYIANQEEHHRKKTFAEEFELFVRLYGLKWREERNR
jgi:REP element-mobilizing transposase RayT